MTEYKYGRYDVRHSEGYDNKDFGVGDVVVIDHNLRICSKGQSVVSEMLKYAGKEATIKCKHDSFYILDIDRGVYHWNDYMLLSSAPVVDEAEFQQMLML